MYVCMYVHARDSRVLQNVFSIGNQHNSSKIQRNCVKYILDRPVKSRHFETELNMSLEHSILGVRNCARAYKCMG